MYNNIARPTELLDRGSSIYNFFKEGITPTWEDPANTKGGRWSFQIKEKGNLDKMWCYLVKKNNSFSPFILFLNLN